MDWWVGIFFLFAVIEEVLGVPAALDHVTQDFGATDLCTQANSQDFGTHSLNYACAPQRAWWSHTSLWSYRAPHILSSTRQALLLSPKRLRGRPVPSSACPPSLRVHVPRLIAASWCRRC
jgi:hypothetical protein